MSNTRRARRRRPAPDLEAGARLALLRSARADGCCCGNTPVQLTKIDLSGSTPAITGNVVHTNPTCPLFAAGPAAPHRAIDLLTDEERAR